MSSITPELADKLLEADAALAYKKLQDGKGITSSQRAYLLSVAGKTALSNNGLARNHVELAKILGCL